MESQSPQPADENYAQHNFERFVQLALEIGERHVRSRGGFGAFRNFRRICLDSLMLALESGFFTRNLHESVHPALFNDKFFFDFYMRRGKFHPNFIYFFEKILSNPASFNPPCLWALFWALAKGEHEFLLRYTPYWSHEERLTGHFISQLITRIEDFEIHWADLEDNQSENKSYCRIHYIDTATARQEKETGADLGLIIQAQFPRQEEFFKAVRFQAKKVDSKGNASIDLNQADTLIKAKNMGYYLFYHQYDQKKWTLPPTVQSALEFDSYVKDSQNKPDKSIDLGKKLISVTEKGYDFATFITFAVADQASEYGELASSAKEAIRLLMATKPQLSRVLCVTLGGEASEVDWNELFDEYTGREQQ
jgi:hypothetical protein